MHLIEPYYNWRDNYMAEEDQRSPFYGRQYDEFCFNTKIYNYCIHPQWDDFGSPTLYAKILFSDYDQRFSIIELIGEWNDCINNDIMFLKRDLIDTLLNEGISRFILIGENVLNLHYDTDEYYEEWYEDVMEDGGWITALNFREHVIEEWDAGSINSYLHYGRKYNDIPWRKFKPNELLNIVESQFMRLLPL